MVKIKKDSIIVIAGIALFVSSYVVYEFYEDTRDWQSFYYIKDYAITFLLFLYATCTTKNILVRVIALFSSIFVLFKSVYELAVFYGLIELNADFGVRLLYFTYSVFIWVIAMIHLLSNNKKRWNK